MHQIGQFFLCCADATWLQLLSFFPRPAFPDTRALACYIVQEYFAVWKVNIDCFATSSERYRTATSWHKLSRNCQDGGASPVEYSTAVSSLSLRPFPWDLLFTLVFNDKRVWVSACTVLYICAFFRPRPSSTRTSHATISKMPRRQEDPDWVWRCHPNNCSPPGNGNADINNPINNVSCSSVTHFASLAPPPRFRALSAFLHIAHHILAPNNIFSH
jgi:hypothetical protein